MSAVVQIVTALERGGAQRITLEIAAGLSRSSRPQYLITGAPPAPLHQEARTRLGPRLLISPSLQAPLSWRADVQALLALSKQLDSLREQHGKLVVHTHSSKAGILGRLAAKSVKRTRTVHTVHGFGIGALGARARPLLIGAEQLASAATDVLVLVSRANRARADAMKLSKTARRLVLPESCDAARMGKLQRDPDSKKAARERLGISTDTPLAVTVGNLKAQKDPLFHVDILQAWRRRVPGAELLFLGDGPLRPEVEGRAAEFGLGAALRLPGFVDDPRDALVAADVMLLASQWEGLPMSVLEALASGLPVVVRNPGWADDVDFCPDRLAALAMEEPASAYADALIALSGLPPKPVELPSLFTWDGALECLDDLYADLLNE